MKPRIGPTYFQPDDGKNSQASIKTEKRVKPEKEKLYCKNCGHWITSGVWRISEGGGHEHTFFNPAGVIFKVGCFKEAPGVVRVGEISDEFTWFANHVWQITLCEECQTHLGWLFTGEKIRSAFFGLILPKLTSRKSV